jgi:DNA modification methylase
MTPFVQDADFTLYVGDALDVLRDLPDESVDCIATSPPFFGLRDYGMEGQIGLEASPEEWAAKLVAVMAEGRRVLKPEGTLWLEVGDIILAGCPAGGTVLDPFLGSGTTALVARKLGRRCVGIELNESYAEMAARRLQQLSLLAEPA